MPRRLSQLACMLAVASIVAMGSAGCQMAADFGNAPAEEQAGGTAAAETQSVQHAAATQSLAAYTRYASLTDDEQRAYDAILAGLRDFDDTITFSASGIDADRLGNIIYAVLFDNPDIFWASSSASWEMSGGTLTMHPIYYYGRADAESLQASIDAAVDPIKAGGLASATTDADKALALAKWVIGNTTYNAQDVESMQNIDSVFSEHVSVCAGYSKALSYLLTQCGIDNLVITGNAANSDGTVEPHAWVLANLDGALTYIDPTWMDNADMTPLLEYFGMSDEECSRMHEADGGNDLSGLVAVSDHAASYTAGTSTYSRDWATSCIRTALSEGEGTVSFVMDDAAAHDALLADLNDGQMLSDALADTGLEGLKSYSYIDNASMQALTLILSS